MTGGIVGKVISADGLVVPGVEVVARRPTPFSSWQVMTRSAGDGTFAIQSVPVGPVELMSSGTHISAPTIAHIVEGGVFDVLVVATRALSIKGRVVRIDSNTPVFGALVSLNSADTGSEVALSPPTELDGTFNVDGIAPGRYFVRASGASGAPAADGSPGLLVSLRGDIDNLIVHVTSMVVVSISTDPPCEFKGRFLIVHREKEWTVDVTSSEKTALVEVLPSSRVELRVVTIDDHMSSASVSLSSRDTHITVPLVPCIPIHGVIRDDQGQPIVGARIRSNTSVRARVPWPFETAVTGLDGSFKTFAATETGVSLTCEVDGVDHLHKADDLSALVEIVVPARPSHASGTVLDADGLPAGGVLVEAISGDRRQLCITRSAMNGAFSTKIDEATSFNVVAFARGGTLRAERRGVRRGDIVLLQLSQVTELHGYVEAEGHFVPGASVMCRPSKAHASSQRTATTDPNGHFMMSDLTAGAWTFTIRCDDGFLVREILLQEASEKLAFSLKAWASIGGRLRDAITGNPIEGLYVIPTAADGLESLEDVRNGRIKKTDQEGAFLISRVGHVSGTLAVYDPSLGVHGWYPTDVSFDATGGGRVELGNVDVVLSLGRRAGTLGLVVKSSVEGLLIADVMTGSPAFEAGLKVGDVICEINGICVGFNEGRAFDFVVASETYRLLMSSGCIVVVTAVALDDS